MSRLAWVLSIVGPVLIVGWAAWPFGALPGVTAQAIDSSTPDTKPPPTHRPLGMGGCAAAGCHGAPAAVALTKGYGPNEPSDWSCSATFWLASDPHNRAYAVLKGPLATAIMDRLNRGAPANPPPLKAFEDIRCLACHTNPGLVAAEQIGSRRADPQLAHLQSDGVSCEACHGNASGWLHPHANWVAADHQGDTFDKAGMTKLYDIGERALMCAGCHVGAGADPKRGYPVRDMNHDMIAAGHPRLNFDFAEYQRRLPPHWHEKDRTVRGAPQRGPDFEARSWLIGRVAHAEAACNLLISRVSRIKDANDPAPWPEFAESSCVSCHHTIGDDEKRFPPPMPGGDRKPGVPSWQPIWPITGSVDHTGVEPGTVGPMRKLLQQTNGPMRKLLQQTEKSRPSPDDTRNAAEAAVRILRDVRGSLVGIQEGPKALEAVKDVVRAGLNTPAEPLDWDRAAQVFQGLAAFERSRGGKDNLVAFVDVQKKLAIRRKVQTPNECTQYMLPFDVPKETLEDLKNLLRN